MTLLLNVQDQRRDEVLLEAADKNSIASMARRLETGWITYKSRFLQVDSSGAYMILERPDPSPGQAPPEWVPGEMVGVSFRRGHKKYLFSGEVLSLLSAEMGSVTDVPALKITWPEVVQEMQRRLYFRANVPSGRRIDVRIWDGINIAAAPAELNGRPHHAGQLLDVSAGGCRVIMDGARNPHLESGDTVIVQFQPDPRTAPIRLDAMFRHVQELPLGKVALGLQFVGLEMSPNGRKTLQDLSRVVSAFLRFESRHKNPVLQKARRRR